jgi:hypothetical protein
MPNKNTNVPKKPITMIMTSSAECPHMLLHGGPFGCNS